MHRFLLAAVATLFVASPAIARDGAGYFGVEGGILFPRDSNYFVTSTRVQTVPTGSGLLGQTVTTSNNSYGSGFVADYKKGVDIDAIAGYDFGFFRLEGELGYKRSRVRRLTASPTLLAAINTAPVSGVTSSSFAFSDRTTVISAMLNALVDVDTGSGVRFYGGGGGGYARVKTLGDRDKGFAWQLIAGVSTAISPNIDLGLKYRYFQTRKMQFDTAASFTGSGGATSVSTFSNEAKFRSHSLLASLIFNFGSATPPPPPPLVEAAPPPPLPPPATQTCADGSVIEATATCPEPPAPPPPPPPPAQGERG